MKRALFPVGAVLTVGLLLGACSNAASPTPSGGPISTASPPASASSAVSSASGQASASAQAGDADQAAALVDAYVKALVAGQWRTAWNMLSAADQARLGSLADYTSERTAFFKTVAGNYQVSAPSNDPALFTQWASSPPLTQGAVLSRGYIVQVTYPNVAGNANFEIYLAAPDTSGAWRLWQLR